MFRYLHHPWAWLAIILSASGHPSTLHQVRNSKRTHLYGYHLPPIRPRLVNASSLTASLFTMDLYLSWRNRSSLLLLMRRLPKSKRREASKLCPPQMLVRIFQMDTSIVISALKNATFWVSRVLYVNNILYSISILIATMQCNTVKQRQTKHKGIVERLCTNKYCKACLKRKYNEDLKGCANGVVAFFKWGNPAKAHLYFINSIRSLLDVRVAEVFAIAWNVEKCWGMQQRGKYMLAHVIDLDIHAFAVL